MSAAQSPGPVDRMSTWGPLLVVLLASAGFETLFVSHGLNVMDEGWPLYAAMGLHAGGTLYRDVFFVFPPGHLLAAWIGYGISPPGLELTRWIYAGFNVALCGALFLLGRRLMPTAFALTGALALAVAAPESHNMQLLFGYRYLVFSVLALLCFDQRLRSDDWRWLLAAGALTGIALCFRLTPAFAVGCGIGVAVVVAAPDGRGLIARCLKDWAAYALGIVVVVVPVVAWFAWDAGLEAIWREAVVRPVQMTALQTRSMPELALPSPWNRFRISEAFVALKFRLVMLLYAGYVVALVVRSYRTPPRWLSSHALLVAIVVWGAVYFSRSLGRSDAPHLDSAIPPACLLGGHLLFVISRRIRRWINDGRSPNLGWIAPAVCSVALLGWVFLNGSDTWTETTRRGETPLRSTGGATHLPKAHAYRIVDPKILEIILNADADDTILDLSAAPLLYVLANRSGPGYADLVMPGTFMNDDEEIAFLEMLQRAPPAVVVMPVNKFDKLVERSVERVAPRIVDWVRRNYEPNGHPVVFHIHVRKPDARGSSPAAD